MEVDRAVLYGVAGIAGFFIVLAGLFFGSTYFFYLNSQESEYLYDATITYNGTINDSVFYLPYPDGADLEFLEGDSYTVSRVNTSQGVMLMVSVDNWTASTRYYRLDLNGSRGEMVPVPPSEADLYNNTVSVSTDYIEITGRQTANTTIDTMNTSGEPLLRPRSGMANASCAEHEGEDCYNYTTMFYSDEDSPVRISVVFEGVNSWWVYGWAWNHYRETTSIHSMESGWNNASARLAEGFGRYTWY